jgi:hypothetical protein
MDLMACKICELQTKMTFSALLLDEVLPLQISHSHVPILPATNLYFTLSSKTSRDNSLQAIVKLPNVNAIWQPDVPSKLSLPQRGNMVKRFIKAVTTPSRFYPLVLLYTAIFN